MYNMYLQFHANQTEEWTASVPRADGDSVRVWVKAHDIMGNTVTDSLLVHVDSSPPIIEDVHLMKYNVDFMTIQHISDLVDIKLVPKSHKRKNQLIMKY